MTPQQIRTSVSEQLHAFPLAFPDKPQDDHWVAYGMLLRDYFAAKALQGMLCRDEPIGSESSLAKYAYRYADAMLAARQQ